MQELNRVLVTQPGRDQVVRLNGRSATAQTARHRTRRQTDYPQGEAVFDPFGRLLEIGLGRGETVFGDEIGQHVLRQRLSLRLGRLAVDAGCFESFDWFESVNLGQCLSSHPRAFIRSAITLAYTRKWATFAGRPRGTAISVSPV
jgi:hypothetical protein